MNGSSDRRVQLTFVEDPIELERTLRSIDGQPGFAWLEEIAFNYPLTLKVGQRDLAARPRARNVIAVDRHGKHVSTDERPAADPIRAPLAYIARTGTGILDRAVADGQSTWVLPGGTAISFVVLTDEPATVRVEVRPSGEHDVAALDAIRDEMRRLVSQSLEYLAHHLPAAYWREWLASAE